MPGTAPAGLDARRLHGPFAVIGDVHGCVHTLDSLLRKLGGSLHDPVPGLTLISVGDLHDNAGPSSGPGGEPGSVEVLRWALREQQAGRLITLDSNHGLALAKYLRGEREISHGRPRGAELTAIELSSAADAATLVPAVEAFLAACPPFARFTGGPCGEFVVAHAAASERTLTAKALSWREYSFHVRAREFRWGGAPAVVTGHVSVPVPKVTRETRADGTLAGPVIRIDTGVDEGGALTAWLPEQDVFVSVPQDPRDRSAVDARHRVLATANA